MTENGASTRHARWHSWRRCGALALLAALSMSTQARPAVYRLEPALAEQRRLVAAHPGDSKLWNDLGSLLLLDNEEEDAETAYRVAVAVGAENSSARYNLALLLLHRGDQAAAAHFESVLELEPLHALAHYQIGAIHEASGHTEAAITSYALAFQLDPDLVFPQTNPDVIQNGLVLEALLRRDKSRIRVPNLPTVYDDAGRIVKLLVPELEP